MGNTYFATTIGRAETKTENHIRCSFVHLGELGAEVSFGHVGETRMDHIDHLM